MASLFLQDFMERKGHSTVYHIALVHQLGNWKCPCVWDPDMTKTDVPRLPASPDGREIGVECHSGELGPSGDGNCAAGRC